jgi:DNA topoisomerase-1
VLALALHLLDLGYFRAGSEQYTEENDSYGVATLMCKHVALPHHRRRRAEGGAHQETR